MLKCHKMTCAANFGDRFSFSTHLSFFRSKKDITRYRHPLNFKPVSYFDEISDISEPFPIRCGSIKNQVQPFDTYKINKDKNINR